MTVSKSPKIAALGYYGFGNLGDEAVLAGIRRALAQGLGPHDFLVLSANEAESSRLHPGVTTVDRWKWRAVAAALRGTDIFVLGGGSLLQDVTSVQSVVWYALMALLARRRSHRIIWWGQGIGPLKSPIARQLVRLIANQADAVTVRDEDSVALLKAIGVRGSIHQVADPAFALEPLSIPRAADPTMSRGTCPVLVALRSWKEDELGSVLRGQSLSSVLRADGGAANVGVCGLPMHLPQDAVYLSELRGGGVTVYDWRAKNWTPEHAIGLVQNASLVVAMRLHALIFAARCAVPFVAIGYDPKVDALATAAGQPDALLPIRGVTAAKLTETVERVLHTADSRRMRLREFAFRQGEAARVPAQICRDIL